MAPFRLFGQNVRQLHLKIWIIEVIRMHPHSSDPTEVVGEMHVGDIAVFGQQGIGENIVELERSESKITVLEEIFDNNSIFSGCK